MDFGIPGLEDVVEIGRGGFATVYRAYQPTFERTVAIKLLNATNLDELSQDRFRRECRAMGLLSAHPSILTVHDAGFLDTGQAYLVMPFMAAGSLSDWVDREGPMPWAEASKVAVRLAGALHAAHDAGVIHRDVKPANVLISEYGETMLADFGIARLVGAAETASGVVTASLAYASPEVIDGKRPTVRSDIYSLGATIYDLLAGHAPFDVGGEQSVVAILSRILTEEPPDLVELGVPRPVVEVITEAMAKDPDDRHDTAAVFGRRMRLAQDELGLRPTELVIAKLEPQDPAATTEANADAIAVVATRIGDEPEPVGLTADDPVAMSVSDETTVVDERRERQPPPLVAPSPDGNDKSKLIRGSIAAAVTTLVVVGLVAAYLLISDGGEDASNSLADSSSPTTTTGPPTTTSPTTTARPPTTTGPTTTRPSFTTTIVPPPTSAPAFVALPDVFATDADEAETLLISLGFTVRRVPVCSGSVGAGEVREVRSGDETEVFVDETGVTDAGTAVPRGDTLLILVGIGQPCG